MMPKPTASSTTFRLVLASNNAKKLAELQALFGGLAVHLVSQGELGVKEADEPFHTFIENGLAKARHAAAATGCAALADDSGLCVNALGGAPGVASAHFAGVVAADPPADAPADGSRQSDREQQRRQQDTANNTLVLEKMRYVRDRSALFISTLVAVRSADDPQPLIAVGRWQGDLLHAPQGEGGFGYDPLMFMPDLGCSAAELSAEEKSQHSHRARAATAMCTLLREVWRL
jgi:XTP/dITP diphosphohydrolase